mmetsp:Transcript_8904/g.36779  ORF Transcript_8904/g.36779 Transcript_8904/m.36779 type:complete len:293 (-) Transcript_8904:808-1686(-)
MSARPRVGVAGVGASVAGSSSSDGGGSSFASTPVLPPDTGQQPQPMPASARSGAHTAIIATTHVALGRRGDVVVVVVVVHETAAARGGGGPVRRRPRAPRSRRRGGAAADNFHWRRGQAVAQEALRRQTPTRRPPRVLRRRAPVDRHQGVARRVGVRRRRRRARPRGRRPRARDEIGRDRRVVAPGDDARESPGCVGPAAGVERARGGPAATALHAARRVRRLCAGDAPRRRGQAAHHAARQDVGRRREERHARRQRDGHLAALRHGVRRDERRHAHEGPRDDEDDHRRSSG